MHQQIRSYFVVMGIVVLALAGVNGFGLDKSTMAPGEIPSKVLSADLFKQKRASLSSQLTGHVPRMMVDMEQSTLIISKRCAEALAAPDTNTTEPVSTRSWVAVNLYRD